MWVWCTPVGRLAVGLLSGGAGAKEAGRRQCSRVACAQQQAGWPTHHLLTCHVALVQVHIPEGLTALDLDVIKLTVRSWLGGAGTWMLPGALQADPAIGKCFAAVGVCLTDPLAQSPPTPPHSGPVCGAQRQVVPDGPGLPRARKPAGAALSTVLVAAA